MTLSASLRREMEKTPPKGSYMPHYFRYLGYRDHLGEPIEQLRAEGIYALFTEPVPHIYRHDLIVGNTRCLYTAQSPLVEQQAASLVGRIGLRHFGTNADHFAPHYQHVLEVGVPGLIGELRQSLARYAGDEGKCRTLQAMLLAVEGFFQMIRHYGEQAEAMKGRRRYDSERLTFIAENCRALLAGPPKTFAQALQLVWLSHTAFMMEGRYAMALGRMDQYLYPFYARDVAAGTLSREGAIVLLENTFAKIPTNDVVNICIGGDDEQGACQVNELSFCILQAVKNGNVPGPNLSARISPGTPDDFLRACLQSIGTGLGYPALMNDTVNIAALRRYGYEERDVYHYCMVGCIENFITGMQPPWSDGRFDAPRFFDYIFNRGVSEVSGTLGVDTGALSGITSMRAFLRCLEKQLSHGVAEYCATFRAYNDGINQAYYTEPFLSCFCYDCIGRGLDINNGGSKYPSVHGAALMGVGTMSDSLAAIEQVVFIDRAATLTELGEALRCNFEGYEALRAKLLAAPKYGNGDEFVDKYAVWFLDFLSSQFDQYKTRDGGGIYVAMAANTSNISAGKSIAATPDGRLRGEPLSDAASPTYGRDKNGITQTLNSVTRPDYTKAACGTVVNQKLSPAMFCGEKLDKLMALVRTYFKKGGQELQMNATSRKVLLAAMAEPEKYGSLVVRVSGFSDYYVRLSRDVQLDILNRTQHE